MTNQDYTYVLPRRAHVPVHIVAAERYSALKREEEKLLKDRGLNPKFGVVSTLNTPRAGAYWTIDENEILFRLLREKRPESGKIGPRALAEVAWELGRSANGIFCHLQKMMGRNLYKEIDV